jgi:UDP-N-acetylglucosamine transferase subunit ALG13
VIIAATGVQRALLQTEFASLTFVDLPGYRVNYGKNRAITIIRMIALIPKILICIKRERAWLRRFAAGEGLDLVISDNRYGLAVPGVFCVFITHQLRILTPFGSWTDGLLQRLNYKLIRRFSRCWIPDIGGSASLAGALSHPKRMPQVTTRYIGVLSRMSGSAATEGTYVLVILSGPEPQRTVLEKDILRQTASVPDPIVLVRGLPGGGRPLKTAPATVTAYDHLPSTELERVMAGARLVIARSGYSTVMDLVRMRKRAVLIPTPGQTEQEYLGRYLAAKGWAVCIPQNKFSLEKALRVAVPAQAWPAEDKGERLRAEVLSVLAQSCPALG